MKAASIVLLRHGRTAWGDERYAGSSDIPLDAGAAEQARALAEWAASQRFTSLASSSLRRARETAIFVANRTGLVPRIEPDLRELDFGTAEGHTLAELRASDPAAAEAFLADPAANPWPGGEDPVAAARRGAACVVRLAREAPGGRVLAVTHRTLIRLVLCDLLGLPLARYRDVFRRLEPLSTTTLEIADSGVGLVDYNVVVVR